MLGRNSGNTMIKKLLLVFCAGVLAASIASGQTYLGNGDFGFGGPIGLGSLNLSSSGNTVNATLTLGTGAFNDGFVIYIDSVGGGLSDTNTYTDTGGGTDYLREAISGFN